ncbi:putative 4-hydroxy-4-methyl-2-oxoglutarate aldolase [Ferrimonas senticii]|uniref:putative 4-hydroxy-4-methyl-2-oxoglutarate aldolase n=1 Tax=Ferrimonas senticii TaxID=394566 RepID=UPI00041F85E5|nr:putative 4-hydroxy-4-methyl-2-oxoglutarate aldolase [Ferrimonas senticii]
MDDLLPELCDRYPHQVTLLPPIFSDFGAITQFGGQLHTVRCPEDNSLVRQILSQPGDGKILLIDGGGLSRRALLGDQLAALAVANGWNGVVVFGYIRDVNAIATMPLGIKALGAVPMKTAKLGLGEQQVIVEIEGVQVHPEHYLYADANGVIISAEPLPLAQQELPQ